MSEIIIDLPPGRVHNIEAPLLTEMLKGVPSESRGHVIRAAALADDYYHRTLGPAKVAEAGDDSDAPLTGAAE